jgi:hypothetical protein
MSIDSPTFFIVGVVGLYPLAAAHFTQGKLIKGTTLPPVVEL